MVAVLLFPRVAGTYPVKLLEEILIWGMFAMSLDLLMGYTGQISEKELDLPQFAKYNPGDVVGKFGIEREYNDWLTGASVAGQTPGCNIELGITDEESIHLEAAHATATPPR